MNDIIQMDIFFFITSIAIIVLTIFFVTALVYVIRILKNVRDISNVVKKESDFLSQDFAELRANVRKEGAKVKHFTSFAHDVYKRNVKERKNKKNRKKSSFITR
ncbi:MAG: hypothetical protein BMS9Abin13_211 [Patescibacteria group bacterium]|nr:MAG: hypothetical protein BMS9Abin13_211 [Patescibacteria group bacterium]